MAPKVHPNDPPPGAPVPTTDTTAAVTTDLTAAVATDPATTEDDLVTTSEAVPAG